MHRFLNEVKKQEIEISKQDVQEKRANCMSSIDHLLRIEASKLNTLKKHKEGLFQQLFPHGSETVPQLRFPEYKNGGNGRKKR